MLWDQTSSYPHNFQTLSSLLVPVAMVMNVSVEAACPSNLLVSWSPLTPAELRAPAGNSSYEVSYMPTAGVDSVSVVEVPYAQHAAMVRGCGTKGRGLLCGVCVG